MTNPQVRFDHVTSVPAVIWPRVKHNDLGDAPYLPSFSQFPMICYDYLVNTNWYEQLHTGYSYVFQVRELLLSGDAMLRVSEMYMLTKCTVVQKCK
jgi:hypothetical protein